MYTKEMNVIEVLLYYLDNQGDFERIVDEEFSSFQSFQSSKINLFNLISINSIVSLNPNLDDESIDKLVSKIELITNHNYTNRELIENIINALRNNNYSFDVNNNIIITCEDLELVVSSSWVYELANVCNDSTFNRVLLFNKNMNLDIHDKKSLLNYLYHTKAFLVSMRSNNKDLDSIYRHAQANAKGMLVDKDSVKTYDIKDALYRNVPSDVETEITSCDLNNYNRLVEKVDSDRRFYNRSLKEQKERLSKWILEDQVVDISDNIELSKLLFLVNKNSSYKELFSSIDRNKCIVALFRMYMWLLTKMDMDYSNLYLSKIRIKSFMTDDLQKDHLNLKRVVRDISSDKYNKDRDELAKQVISNVSLSNALRENNMEKDNETVYTNIKSLVHQYVDNVKAEEKLCNKRNSLQNVIQYKQENSALDVAFDNDVVMDLILSALYSGKVYVDNKDVIHIEKYNDETGMKIFEGVIPFRDFIYFVECSNEDLIEFRKAM